MFCGKTVSRKPRFIFDFYKQIFAWHIGKCADQDPAFKIACKAFSAMQRPVGELAYLEETKELRRCDRAENNS
jgi:hypothetical protein